MLGLARCVPSSKRSLNSPTTLKGTCNLFRRECLRSHIVGSLLLAPGQRGQTFLILFGVGYARGRQAQLSENGAQDLITVAFALVLLLC